MINYEVTIETPLKDGALDDQALRILVRQQDLSVTPGGSSPYRLNLNLSEAKKLAANLSAALVIAESARSAGGKS